MIGNMSDSPNHSIREDNNKNKSYIYHAVATTATAFSLIAVAAHEDVQASTKDFSYQSQKVVENFLTYQAPSIISNNNVYEYSTQEIIEDSDTLTIPDMVEKIKKVFGLNNVQVAQSLGISRPTLYNHLNGKEDPISIENYKDIYNIACLVEKEISCDLRRGLKSVLVEGKTLLGYLKEETINKEQILKVAQLIKNKLVDTSALNSTLNVKDQIRTSRAISRTG